MKENLFMVRQAHHERFSCNILLNQNQNKKPLKLLSRVDTVFCAIALKVFFLSSKTTRPKEF
ncbi:hypothetical protein [Moraxella lacunata]|uniref:hypothetical protein n=1 Tax=Moraxella lacunata TaxID=477 RepID=UPI003EE32138